MVLDILYRQLAIAQLAIVYYQLTIEKVGRFFIILYNKYILNTRGSRKASNNVSYIYLHWNVQICLEI